MQIIVKVWSSNSEGGLRFDYATINCTATFLEHSLQRIGAFRDRGSLDPSLEEMRYWDLSAEYFSLWAEGASREADELSCGLEKSIDALEVDKREAVLTAEDLNVSEERLGAVESSMMIVRNDGIAFSAILKDDDVRLTTAEIPQELLRLALSTLP